MTFKKRILALIVLVAFAAGAAPLWFSGRLADPAMPTNAWSGEFSATLSLARSADGSGVVSNVSATMIADANGLFGFGADLPAEELLGEAGDAYLVASFTDGGTRQTTLPAQRVGFTPYAIHAGSTYTVENRTQLALASLAVTNIATTMTLSASERIDVTGLFLITNGVTRPKTDDNRLTVDRLELQGGVTQFIAPETDAETLVCGTDEAAEKTILVKYDGIGECAVTTVTNATLQLVIVRKDNDDRLETLFDATCTTGGSVQKVAFPVCAGDTINLTALADGSAARVVWKLRTFGVKMEDE